MQVLTHSWVNTRGGLVPKLLNPNVARGAANVASVRRLRNLVHGAIALKSLRALKVGHRISPQPAPCTASIQLSDMQRLCAFGSGAVLLDGMTCVKAQTG